MVRARLFLASALADVGLLITDSRDALIRVDALPAIVEHLLLTFFNHAG
jgi:hypothetical protein